MRDLNYALKKLCHEHKEGSFATRRNRAAILKQTADELHELGFKNVKVDKLKGRHVTRLLEHWQDGELSLGTIKNRMAALRWWAQKTGRGGVIANNNEHYGLGRRTYVDGMDKSRRLDKEKLESVTDPHVRAALLLQEAFGLRRQEAIKFTPSYADRKDYIRLKGSWTKGGRPRKIQVRTAKQRDALAYASSVAGSGALIPSHKNYKEALNSYKHQTLIAGLNKNHGLRHAYAHFRYRELTGREPPCCGGPSRKSLSKKELLKDNRARKKIARELGHGRIGIVAAYCG